MLRELHISNLAVIADARIEFDAGLNCFTGATGAGKSLIIGAIELLLGLRSGGEMLRSGTDEARISGSFELTDPSVLKQIADATDTPADADGGTILLTRRLFASGRSSVSLNGHPITLGMLKTVADALVDVHGQHDHQYLLRPSNQLDVIDRYANLWSLRETYHAAFRQLEDAKAKLAELSTNQALRAQQLDLYRFQAAEIDAAELNAGEFEELRARASVLENLGKLKKDAAGAYTALYEADGSILERLKMMSAIIAELTGLDANLKNVAGVMRDATLQLEDAAFDLGRYLDKLDLDPAELAEVNDRLNTLNRLLNKYGDRGGMNGDSIASVVAYREEIGRTIARLDRAGEDASELEAQIGPLTRRIAQLGEELATRRKTAAAKLSPMIEKQFVELGMDKARFEVQLTRATEPTASGLDQIEFIAKTNPGLPPQPLRKIASGGELSRIMLALKSVLALGDRVSVLVFDEIDSNVGGRLGSIIGAKLRDLASRHQVLCITHLPQIASFADRHLTVRKQSSAAKTSTTVRLLSGDDRIEELAEMIGGQHITETTRAQARELLQTGQSKSADTPKTASRSTEKPKGRQKPDRQLSR